MIYKKLLYSFLRDCVNAFERTISSNEDKILLAAETILNCLLHGNKVLLCGNGGSASDSQHIAAEFVNRFKMERRPLPAIALTTDTSILTAIANDYSFDEVFKKQVEALGSLGDVLIGISTSGNSKNVIAALKKAKEKGIITIGLTGKGKCQMDEICDINIKVESKDTPRIQEVHIFLGHVICDIVERGISN